MTDSTSSADGTSDAPKALTTKSAKLHMGLLAAQADPVELQANILACRDRLFALVDDPSMPEDARQAVRDLAAYASPTKPGLEEMLVAWKLPRVMIAQLSTRTEAKPESAKGGDLFTTAGILLPKPFEIIPAYFHEENINFKDGQKVPVCSSPDAKLGSPLGECAKCPFLPFGKQNGGQGDQEPTDCTNNIVCIAVPTDLSQVYAVQFGKTSHKAGRAMMQLAGAQKQVWAQSYRITTDVSNNASGKWWHYKVEATGRNNPDHVRKLVETIYALYIAERKLMLHGHYTRPARAPQAAAEAEGNFAAGAIEANLASGDGSGGEEADLTTPVTPIATGNKNARSTHKPM